MRFIFHTQLKTAIEKNFVPLITDFTYMPSKVTDSTHSTKDDFASMQVEEEINDSTPEHMSLRRRCAAISIRSMSVQGLYFSVASAYMIMSIVVLSSNASFDRRVGVMQSTTSYLISPLIVSTLIVPVCVYALFATVLLPVATSAMHVCANIPFHVHRALSLPILFVIVANDDGALTAAELALICTAAFALVYHGVVHDAASRCRQDAWLLQRRSFRSVHQLSALVPLVGVGIALSGSEASPSLLAAQSIVLTAELLIIFTSVAFVIASEPYFVFFVRLQVFTTVVYFFETIVSLMTLTLSSTS